MSDENKKYRGIFDSLAVIVMLVIALIIIDTKTDLFKSSEDAKENTSVIVQHPPLDNGTGGQEIQTLDLINSSFFAPADVFTTKYDASVIRLGLWGDFQDAVLVVKGETTNVSKNFIIINLGKLSGTYNGERLKTGEIEVSDQEAIFTKEKPLDVAFDLKNPIKLSRTTKEVGLGLRGFQMITLWDTIAPPPKPGTVAKLILAPYSERGQIGDDSSITQIQLNYTCTGHKDSCKAFVCDSKVSNTVCLQKNVNNAAATSYQKAFIK